MGQAAPQFLADDQDGLSPATSTAKRKLEQILGVAIASDRVRAWPEWLRGYGVTSVEVQEWSARKRAGLPAAIDSDDEQTDAFEVLVAEELPQADINRLIPKEVDGIPVYVKRSGPIVAQPGPIVAQPAKDGDGMGNVVTINTDVMGETLRGLGLDEVEAHGGRYVRDGATWTFCLDTLTRVMLFLRGVDDPPCSVPADKLVCWKTVPTHPLIGGFTHPMTGFHCRAEAIPVAWDTLLHGRPGLTLRGGDGNLLSSLSDAGSGAAPSAIAQAQSLAQRINTALGVTSGKPVAWWLYTLPSVRADGAPLVTIGIKSDNQPKASDMKTLPWADWRKAGVAVQFEFVPLKASGGKASPPVEVLPAATGGGMGSAPVDKVWPTSSPDWREPTGPATGYDAGMGNGMQITGSLTYEPYNDYMWQMREKGRLMSQQPGDVCPPVTTQRSRGFSIPSTAGGTEVLVVPTCVPGDSDAGTGNGMQITGGLSYEPYDDYMEKARQKGQLLGQQTGQRCPRGTTLKKKFFSVPSTEGGRDVLIAKTCEPRPAQKQRHGRQRGDECGMGQSSHGFPLRWRDPQKYGIQPPTDRVDLPRVAAPCQQPWPPGPPGDASNEDGYGMGCMVGPADLGMGSAPIVAMPTGMLNWDRVTGYEGRPWITKDWSGQGFMGDDASGSVPATPSTGRKYFVLGGLALAGVAAGFAASRFFGKRREVIS